MIRICPCRVPSTRRSRHLHQVYRLITFLSRRCCHRRIWAAALGWTWKVVGTSGKEGERDGEAREVQGGEGEGRSGEGGGDWWSAASGWMPCVGNERDEWK
ncbi:hypothetical protein E2562_012662 [Oryza meyeriana var. granulata]|uniref:Uncharacterized protein n=1 Tax=Oryza meyeriana var. granulata TaxID=110450 RepID=A0A6G1CFM8_9ORYZ|nr:hypothetical protein E2562_012662 [Oryza meyeriana var. granulata]